MGDVLAISVPFFALIFSGFGVRATGLFDNAGARTLAKFAFYVALPPMLFVKVAVSDPADIFNWGFVWRYESATILLFLGTAYLSRSLFGFERLTSGIFGLNIAYPNYGYMGVPLCILAFGDAAALPLALLLFADTIVLLMILAYFAANTKQGLAQAVPRILAEMMRNPLLIAVVAGLVYAAFDVQMPVIASRTLNMLADAAPPVALFALGATLYGQPIRAAAAEVSVIGLFKLVIHPLLVAALFLLIPGQDIVWIKVAILSACLPVAANVFMLADHYQTYAGRSASAIFVSTLLASLTVPVVLYILFTMLG